MAYDNSGILFKNTRKEKDTHPDYNGSITINGTEHWLSAWIKKGDKGSFMTLSIGDVKKAKESSSGPDEFEDDDIPF